MIKFKVLSINISEEKGQKKNPVKYADFKKDYGILDDAHAGNWHRQVSLLAQEDIECVIAKGLEIQHGDFAENITTLGIDMSSLPIGSRLFINEVVLDIRQIGKKCHHGCAIYKLIGDCVMPKHGVFAKVLHGGHIEAGDTGYY
ncbi:MAG: hypothetical protein A2176_10455 [Spirochaetes bacterium RBG_13_51_14]|nr:MAG: hypothetical protein A2176_10455 [Spirochaetes bacterium RBG_13_51_14]